MLQERNGVRVEIGEIDACSSSGKIEVIDGCMSSGKSKELIRRVSVLRHSVEARILSGLEEKGLNFEDLVVVFKPAIEKRRGDSTVNSRDGEEASAISIQNIEEIFAYIDKHPNTKTIAIDEAQFFNGPKLIEVTKFLADRKNMRVIVAGLAKDFKGDNWGGVAELGSIANEHIHLLAACAICGGEATMTQRLKYDETSESWIAASRTDEVEEVGEKQYQARCRKHHQLT